MCPYLTEDWSHQLYNTGHPPSPFHLSLPHQILPNSILLPVNYYKLLGVPLVSSELHSVGDLLCEQLNLSLSITSRQSKHGYMGASGPTL